MHIQFWFDNISGTLSVTSS